MTMISKNKVVPGNLKGSSLKRREFLTYSGIGLAATAALLVGCEDMISPKNGSRKKAEGDSIDLGSGDVGILNYAYALEQLEAAFYTMVVAHEGFNAMYNEEEQSVLMDLKNHEIVHREFLKAALGDNAIPGLTPDFSSIDFSSRASVLGTAKVFEDLGVSAYNGAGKLIQNMDYLLVAGKIVSVEARHASAIRDLINPLSRDFAGDDVIDAQGLDRAWLPMNVLPLAQPFIKETLNGSNLPTA